jgi:hypothetical protein
MQQTFQKQVYATYSTAALALHPINVISILQHPIAMSHQLNHILRFIIINTSKCARLHSLPKCQDIVMDLQLQSGFQGRQPET